MEAIKTISSGYLLQQVQARFKPNHSNWRADALDNIGLIVNEIGHHAGYEPKDVKAQIKNYKVRVPTEVLSINHIKHNGIILTPALDKYSAYDNYGVNRRQLTQATHEDAMFLEKQTKRLKTLKELYLENPTVEVLDSIENAQRKINQMVEGLTYQGFTDYSFNWFRLEGGYIKTSFEEGLIVINADAYMVDEAGLPMVVDTFYYREACIWGILYYMMLGGYKHPVLSFEKVEHDKDYFIGRAQNEPHVMSVERHQRFTEEWSSLARGVSNETLNHL